MASITRSYRAQHFIPIIKYNYNFIHHIDKQKHGQYELESNWKGNADGNKKWNKGIKMEMETVNCIQMEVKS